MRAIGVDAVFMLLTMKQFRRCGANRSCKVQIDFFEQRSTVEFTGNVVRRLAQGGRKEGERRSTSLQVRYRSTLCL